MKYFIFGAILIMTNIALALDEYGFSYEIFTKKCVGVICTETPLYKGEDKVRLASENDNFMNGVKTVNFKIGERAYKIFVSLSKEQKNKVWNWDLFSSALVSHKAGKDIFSESELVMPKIIYNSELILHMPDFSEKSERIRILLQEPKSN